MPKTRKAKTSAQKNAANRALATGGKAAPRAPRARKADAKATPALVTPSGLNDWLLGTPCYAPKSSVSKKLVFQRPAFEELLKANGVWRKDWADIPSPGRIRMIGAIALRHHVLKQGKPLVSPFAH